MSLWHVNSWRAVWTADSKIRKCGIKERRGERGSVYCIGFCRSRRQFCRGFFLSAPVVITLRQTDTDKGMHSWTKCYLSQQQPRMQNTIMRGRWKCRTGKWRTWKWRNCYEDIGLVLVTGNTSASRLPNTIWPCWNVLISWLWSAVVCVETAGILVTLYIWVRPLESVQYTVNNNSYSIHRQNAQ